MAGAEAFNLLLPVAMIVALVLALAVAVHAVATAAIVGSMVARGFTDTLGARLMGRADRKA